MTTKIRFDQILGAVISVDRFGATGSTILSGGNWVGPDESTELQDAIDYALSAPINAQNGITILFPSGGYKFATGLVANFTGASNIRFVGEGKSSRLIYTGTGKALDISGNYDGAFDTQNVFVHLKDLMLYGRSDLVAATDDTIGLSFDECAHIKLDNVETRYFSVGMYFKDTPGITLWNTKTEQGYIGLKFKHTDSFPNTDLAVVSVYNHVSAGCVEDVFIDGIRDIAFYGGVLASEICAEIRSSGALTYAESLEVNTLNATYGTVWTAGESYVVGDVVTGTAEATYPPPTTMTHYYKCISNHIAAAADKPVTGANYATYWARYPCRQVENVQFIGTFFDLGSLTSANVMIGSASDPVNQIHRVDFKDCHYITLPTKACIAINGPLVNSVTVDGGFIAETATKFMVIGQNASASTRVKIENLGTYNCMKYRVTDERSATARTELFDLPPSLQLNPDFYLFPLAYAAFGYLTENSGYASKTTVAGSFVTGDCLFNFLADVANQATLVWFPANARWVEQGTDIIVEWIAKDGVTTPAKALPRMMTADLDGVSNADVTILDVSTASLIQSYTVNSMKRYMNVYRVPVNRVLTGIQMKCALNELVQVDYFNVYGPAQYRPQHLYYQGVDADYGQAVFKAAKFRGYTSLKNDQAGAAGEADQIYLCAKDNGAATYTWNLVG